LKILLCFGTRPEAIKMAPIIHELNTYKLNYKVCVTGQHREMLDQVLTFFEIVPDYDLDLMRPNQSLNLLSAKILNKIDVVLVKEQPNIVLVHGDTTTSSMIALAAFNRGIKVGHVEAGLRTYNKKAPFPEELNRQLTAKIADFHFAPTQSAVLNLLKENIFSGNIVNTGNTVVDALQWAVKKMESQPLTQETKKIKNLFDPNKKLILVTGHRRENFGQGLINICEALLQLSKREDVEIIYPVHLNPRVKVTAQKILGNIENIHLIDPISYPTMLWLMKQCHLIISDSGGIQEEAPTFKKSVLVTRDVSERMEGVQAGFSVLVGTNHNKIVKEAVELLEKPKEFLEIKNPYGDGKAAYRIVKSVRTYLN
tara:strand:+ start:17534 stop:18640 length:1107 start_codon:yes stop_codon:yes gene_type:complete